MMPELFPRGERPWLITILLGTNDAALEAHKTSLVPLDEYEANLKQMIAHAKESAEHVVVMTPPAMIESQRLAFQVEKYGRDVQPALVIGRHYVTERDSAPVQYNGIV